MKNIVYLDTTTNKIKTTTYAKFDEAHFSYENKPPGARILIDLGLKSTINDTKISQNPTLQIVKTHPKAIIPKQGSTNSAGYDLYSITNYVIPHTYGRVASRSGLALHHQVETKGGVIDPDYTGNIKIILHNFGSKDYTVKESDRVAQLILEQYLAPPIQSVTKVPQTARNSKGFGSTGIRDDSSSKVPTIPRESAHTVKPTVQKVHTTTHSLNCVPLDMVFTKPVNTTTVAIP